MQIGSGAWLLCSWWISNRLTQVHFGERLNLETSVGIVMFELKDNTAFRDSKVDPPAQVKRGLCFKGKSYFWTHLICPHVS